MDQLNIQRKGTQKRKNYDVPYQKNCFPQTLTLAGDLCMS